MLEWDAKSKPCMVMERRGNTVHTKATMGEGEGKLSFEESMQFGVERKVSDNEKDPKMCNSFLMVFKDGNICDEVTPIVPPGKKYTVVTKRVGEELHCLYTACDDPSVTGKRIFKKV